MHFHGGELLARLETLLSDLRPIRVIAGRGQLHGQLIACGRSGSVSVADACKLASVFLRITSYTACECSAAVTIALCSGALSNSALSFAITALKRP